MGPNPAGPVDDVVSVVTVDSSDGPVGVIWSAACHPTSLPGPLAVSAHFPGVVRGRIRSARWGGDHGPVLFLQGFSGDVRPPAVAPARAPAAVVRRLRLGPTFRDFDGPEYDRWATTFAQAVASAMSGVQPAADADLHAARTSCARAEVVVVGDATSPLTLQALVLGDVAIVGGSAEFVAEYADPVRRLLPGMLVVPVGCIDDVIGYLPTERMLGEGGYEVVHHCRYFGNGGSRSGAERAVLAAFARLVDPWRPARA